MSLTHTILIQLREREAKAEVRAMAEFARRSLGQSIRRALERLAKRREL